MNLHSDIVKECFPSWVHIKVLQWLFQHTDSAHPMSQRQAASILGLPRATVNRVFSDLSETELITTKKIGTANHWHINRHFYLYEEVKRVMDQISTLRLPIQYLLEIIQSGLKLPSGYSCYLFGSIVSGEEKSGSDVDLCILLPEGMNAPSQNVQNQIDQLQDEIRIRFSRLLNPLYLERSAQKRNKILYQNAVLKGVKINHHDKKN